MRNIVLLLGLCAVKSSECCACSVAAVEVDGTQTSTDRQTD